MDEDGARPFLARLDAYLSGEADMGLTRPPVPRYNPRHDLYGWREEKPTDLKALLGAENFVRPPAPPKPVHVSTLYTTGQLGKVINRSTQAIRKWERDGVLPRATHWSKGEDGDQHVMPDGTVVTQGRRKRLYTHSQVMGLLALATEAGMSKNRTASISGTNFVAGARKLWEECAEDELRTLP